MNSGTVSSGTLLIILGVWVVFQTLAGDLSERIMSYANSGNSAGPTIYQPGSGPDPNAKYPYTVQPNAPGAAPGQSTIIPVVP